MFSFLLGTIAVAGVKTIVTGGGIDDFFESVGEVLFS
jgi:hypothetical protein